MLPGGHCPLHPRPSSHPTVPLIVRAEMRLPNRRVGAGPNRLYQVACGEFVVECPSGEQKIICDGLTWKQFHPVLKSFSYRWPILLAKLINHSRCVAIQKMPNDTCRHACARRRFRQRDGSLQKVSHLLRRAGPARQVKIRTRCVRWPIMRKGAYAALKN